MKALVTGATGFIGARLCRALAAQGHQVRALVLPGESTAHLEGLVTDFHQADLRQAAQLAGAADDLDVVFHLAARVVDWGRRRDFYDSILLATENLLAESAGRVSRFVYVSSMAACGLGRHLKGVCEDEPPQKSGVPYNDAKLEAEAAVRSYQGRDGLDCVIIRPANVIGPGSVWVREVMARYRSGLVPLLDGGRHSASLIYVDNLVDGLLLAATVAEASGRIYHLRDDWQVTWKDYLTDLGAMVGSRPHFSFPFRLAWPLGALLEAVVTPLGLRPPLTRLAAGVLGRDNDVDNSRAKGELGWQTRITYEQAMAEIRAWVLSQTRLNQTN